MTDVSQGNDAAARSPTGEILDQTTKPEPTKVASTEETKTSPPEAKKDGDVSFLNDGEKKEGEEGKEGDKGEKKEATGAPDKYEPFTLPKDFEANEEVMAEAQAVFKELGLPQEAAQKLVDFHAKQAAAAANAPVEYWKQMQKDWQAEIKADKDLGGKIPEVKATISKAIDLLGPLAVPFREAMDLTGAGNNPAFVRSFFKFAQLLTEGAHVAGAGPSKAGQLAPGTSDRPTAAKALYPNLA